MTPGQVPDVRAAERRRCAAMLAGDLAALDDLLDDDLHFSHATGAVDDKAAYLAKVGSGRITYATIAWRDVRVRTLGQDAALMTGRMLSTVRVEETVKSLDNRVMSIWTRAEGDWKLRAFQSTPLKA